MRLDRTTIKEECIPKMRQEWQTAPDSFPDFLHEIPRETRLQNEQYLKTVIGLFRQQFQDIPFLPNKRKKWQHKTRNMIDAVLKEETVLGVHLSMENQAIDRFLVELAEFFRHVRRFAPELALEGVGQAARNYVVYAMFNEINRINPGFSKACFGYSMLYPFTDNFIDNPRCSDKDKSEYNQLIRDKIEGKNVHPQSRHSLKTCKLLHMIESAYPRNVDPTGSSLLLLMLEAQESSLRQQCWQIVLTAQERLDISIYKGGISVLIDRFFVDKAITVADLDFYFGFGFFLQLADDLQDIKVDSTAVNQTIFTVDLHWEREERIVNKMLNFIYRIAAGYQTENETFKEFILEKCYQLVFLSAFQSKEFFSSAYLERLERCFPVSCLYLETMDLQKIETKDLKIQNKYMKILDGLIRQDNS